MHPVDIGVLTDDVFDRARGLGDRRWRIADRAEVSAQGDGQRLTQAWLQLCANAVKFSEPETTIEIGSASDDRSIRLWVADEGPGVSEADRHRIFERFERSGSGTQEGSGLGLAIVSAIAHAHGGHASCDARPGRGATFTIHLPAREMTTESESENDE